MAIVTFEAVAAAAESLQAAGQRASVRAVTNAIGGGSPNTILKLLGEWKAGRPVVRIADTELDAKISSAIIEQMQRVATAASAAAEERAAGIDEDLQALAEAQATAEQQIATLTTERDSAQAQTAEVVAQLKEAHAAAQRTAEQTTATTSALRISAIVDACFKLVVDGVSAPSWTRRDARKRGINVSQTSQWRRAMGRREAMAFDV